MKELFLKLILSSRTYQKSVEEYEKAHTLLEHLMELKGDQYKEIVDLASFKFYDAPTHYR